MVVRGRWARVGCLLVCWRTALVMSKYMPLVQPDRNSGACRVIWFRSGFDEKSEALLSAPIGIRDPGRRARLPDHGVRERPIAGAGCHATPVTQGSVCCGYRENRCRKNGPDLTAFANSDSARGESRLRSSQASLNSNCQKNRRKQFSSPTMRHIACNVVVNAFQQYERLASLATAK